MDHAREATGLVVLESGTPAVRLDDPGEVAAAVVGILESPASRLLDGLNLTRGGGHLTPPPVVQQPGLDAACGLVAKAGPHRAISPRFCHRAAVPHAATPPEVPPEEFPSGMAASISSKALRTLSSSLSKLRPRLSIRRIRRSSSSTKTSSSRRFTTSFTRPAIVPRVSSIWSRRFWI